MSSKILFVGAIIFGLFVTSLIFRNGDLMWMAIIFIVYMGTGIALSPTEKDICLQTRRYVKKTGKSCAFFVEMTLEICNKGRKGICLRLSDPLLEGMKIIDGSLKMCVYLRPGKKAELNYTFNAVRGRFAWHKSLIMAGDPFGLAESGVELNDMIEIFIQPQFKKFKPVFFRPWKTLSSIGLVPSRAGGFGTDFWGIRDYHPGDPLKLLDWRLAARHPHKYYIKEFVQEKTAEIAILLDGREKMNLVINKESIYDIEVKAAASLAEMFIRQGHRVSLFAIGEILRYVLPAYGKIQLNRILNCLSGVRSGSGSLENIPVEHISNKSIIMVLSPVDFNDIYFYKRLKSNGFDVILISPDVYDFSEIDNGNDKIGDLAFRASCLERGINLNLISRLSVSVVDWHVKEPLPPLIQKTFIRNQRLRRI